MRDASRRLELGASVPYWPVSPAPMLLSVPCSSSTTRHFQRDGWIRRTQKKEQSRMTWSFARPRTGLIDIALTLTADQIGVLSAPKLNEGGRLVDAAGPVVPGFVGAFVEHEEKIEEITWPIVSGHAVVGRPEAGWEPHSDQ